LAFAKCEDIGMKKQLSLLAALFAVLGTHALADDSKPLRHLVYNFTVGISTNTAISSDGIGTGGSGVANYGAGLTDQGTITVDVVQAVDDKVGKALVLNVSEQARNGRTATVVPCIVYSDGSIVYDPGLKLNDEERSIIKYLGRGFFDAKRLDTNGHWQILRNDPQGKMQADYTVKTVERGIVNIEAVTTLNVRGASALDSTANTKLVYDLNKTVAKTIHEETLDRQNEGMGKYNTTRTQVDADLASDSMP